MANETTSSALTPLCDGSVALGIEMFSGLTRQEIDELKARTGAPSSSVNGFLYEAEGRTLLIDAGGNGLVPGLGDLASKLEELDVAAHSVDSIFLTHIHPDHVGGLMSGGVPVFTNASLRLSAAEHSFWTNTGLRANLPPDFQPFFDFVQDLIAAYEDRIELFSGEVEIAPGVHSLPLSGHTPGHTGLHIDNETENVLIWGDIVHVPEFQLAAPHAAIVFDVDPDAAVACRKDILARMAGSGQRIAGGHLTGIGRIERSGDGYAFLPESTAP